MNTLQWNLSIVVTLGPVFLAITYIQTGGYFKQVMQL